MKFPASSSPPFAPGDAAGWRRQLRDAWRTPDDLKRFRFPAMRVTDGMREAARRFRMAVTPHYASLVRVPDFSDPVFAQCVPSPGELLPAPFASPDPLGECAATPVPRLVRRYGDRAVLLASATCACYCRHCFRKRVSGAPGTPVSDAELASVSAWLRRHPEVDDVLVSGGDPLTLSDRRVGAVLAALVSVSSVRVIRVASRLPATLPQRFTPALVRILAAPARRPGGAAVYLMSQFNHPRELAPEAVAAVRALVDSGVPVCNQTVLLRGVNDSADVLEALFRSLYHARVRPYYLFQTDLVCDIEHLRTPVATGLEIMRELRARLSGPAIPNFCLDPPGGGGKIELSPDYVVRKRPGVTFLRNGRGVPFRYPDPDPTILRGKQQ